MTHLCLVCKQQREQGCFNRGCPGIPNNADTTPPTPAEMLTKRMMFWDADPTEDQVMQYDEESVAEYFAQNMRGDVIEVKICRAVELEPRMMRVYAPTDYESLPRWEWLP